MYRQYISRCGGGVGIIGSMFFYGLFKQMLRDVNINSSKLLVSLSYVGQNTLDIYILQTFFLEFILSRLLNFGFMQFVCFDLVVAPIISFFVIYMFVCCKIFETKYFD